MEVISEKRRRDALERILGLSRRITYHSAPMKPFLRFGLCQRPDVNRSNADTLTRSLWDFDDLLQKKLLELTYTIASPVELLDGCTRQWMKNLQGLKTKRSKSLQGGSKNRMQRIPAGHPRIDFITRRISQGQRFLYVGCGSGIECLAIASKGINVVGIDTDPELVGISNTWAKHCELPFSAVCMDVMKLDFDPESFDGFLLEFYGYSPQTSQTLVLQQNLHRILKNEGNGFIIASRKKYPSYLFKVGRYYSAPLTRWLLPQAALDFRDSGADGCEERLISGIYNRSHTVKSLASELQLTFSVRECHYEQHNRRYVIATVTRKRENGNHDAGKSEDPGPIESGREEDFERIVRIVAKVECLCNILQSHTRKLEEFFQHQAADTHDSPLVMVDTDLGEFMALALEVLELPVGHRLAQG